jgi:hypothetical protein
MTKTLFLLGLFLAQLTIAWRKSCAIAKQENEVAGRALLDKYRTDHPEIYVREILAKNRKGVH